MCEALTEVMESANREEGKRCLNKARDAFQSGDVAKAKRLTQKSLKLCPTQEARELLERLDQDEGGNTPQPEPGVRQRSTGGQQRERMEPDTGASEAPEEDYTEEQRQAVLKVLRCKDYYEVLGVARDASDTELKKAYKRLALALHPDKNRAPQADEAFKAVGKAYATLSDATRRNNYDRFGEDGLRQQVGSPDISPDDIFNMFFGGNGGIFFEDDGFLFSNQRGVYRTRGFHRPNRHYFQHRTHTHRHQERNNLFHLCQVLPILLIIMVSLLSSVFTSIFSPPMIFSLRRTGEFTERRVTRQHSIPYYVKTDFDKSEVRAVEREVLEMHVWELSEQCRLDSFRRGRGSSEACKKLKKLRQR